MDNIYVNQLIIKTNKMKTLNYIKSNSISITMQIVFISYLITLLIIK